MVSAVTELGRAVVGSDERGKRHDQQDFRHAHKSQKSEPEGKELLSK